MASTEPAEEGAALRDADSALYGNVDEWTAEDVDLLAAWITGDGDDASAPQNATTTGSSDSSAASSQASSPPADRNLTRQRRREEVGYLRERVREMESELAALRARGGGGSPTAAASEWEAIATRQRSVREKAEIENHRLRAQLASQLKLAKTLERLLRKRDAALTTDSGSKRRRLTSTMGTDAGDVFTRLLAGIDRSFAETTTVLTANGLLDVSRGLRRSVGIKRAQGPDTERDELYVEMTDVSTMPFPIERTADAAWRCITTGYMQLDHQVYEGFAGQHDVLGISYAITLARRRLRVDFTACAAMKRFVERDRIVDVWESIADTEGAHVSSHGGLQVRERGWTVFERIAGDALRTRVLTCMQMIPLISYSADQAENRQVGLLTNLALDYYGDQLDLAQQGIESLLLDQDRSDVVVGERLPNLLR